ncbi:MAG: YeiH family protein [Azospira sp.]|jgi:uncharacterized integral membrane protein (TIGR00698 family)
MANLRQWRQWIPGLALAAAISVLALGLALGGGLVRYGASSLTLAILIGAVLGNGWPTLAQGARRAGLGLAQRNLLRAGVALYGFNLSWQQIVAVGSAGLLADVLLVASTLALGCFIGIRLLGLDRETALLTAAGSAICGAAAVVATVPVLRLDEARTAEKTAVAVGTVVLFGTLAMGLYPLLYAWIGPQHLDFGRYVGSTVHEVAQVVAIGDALGPEVARGAVVVKMIRVLLLVPFLLLLGAYLARRGGAEAAGASRRSPVAVPWFAVAFILLAGVNSLQLLPEGVVAALRQCGMVLLTAAMAALGLETTLARMGRAGLRPLLLGAALFVHLVLGGGLLNWLLG